MFKERRSKFLFIVVFSIAIFISPFFVFAEDLSETTEVQQFKTNLVYFYSKTCSHCKRIKPFIDEMEKRYGEKINFKRYELSESQENINLFVQFLDAYDVGVGQGAVPVAFLGEEVILGDVSLEEGLEGVIGDCVLDSCKLVNNLDGVIGGLIPVEKTNRSKLSIPLVVGAAFIDSINPCAIAVLLFLVAFLLAIKMSRKRLLLVGGIYILTVMIVYVAAGFGLLKFIGYFDLEKSINYFAAVILVFAGLVSVKDFWWYGKGISLKIPDRLKPKIERYLTKATIPSVIVAGFLVSVFELPCTGEVYLGILSLMSQEAQSIKSILYLLLYNFIFVLPLIIILLLAVAGLNVERIEQIRYERRRWLKLLLGFGMLILAAWLVL